MKIYLATDHAGYYLKESFKKKLEKDGFLVKDFSKETYDETDDYPDYIIPCVKEFLQDTGGDFAKGRCIIFGSTGTGEAIAANRFKFARAVVLNCSNLEIVRFGRAHNNANILSLGASFVGVQLGLDALKVFFETHFDEGRHKRRIGKIDEYAKI